MDRLETPMSLSEVILSGVEFVYRREVVLCREVVLFRRLFCIVCIERLSFVKRVVLFQRLFCIECVEKGTFRLSFVGSFKL